MEPCQGFRDDGIILTYERRDLVGAAQNGLYVFNELGVQPLFINFGDGQIDRVEQFVDAAHELHVSLWLNAGFFR